MHFYVEHSNHILPHINYPAVVLFEYRHRTNLVLHHDVGIGLCDEFTFGRLYKFYRQPVAVVVSGFCPFTKLLVGIVGFSVKLVCGTDRTVVGNFPAFVATYHCRGAVVVGNFKLQKKLRHSVVHGMSYSAPFEIKRVVADSCEATAFECDTNCIVAFIEQ